MSSYALPQQLPLLRLEFIFRQVALFLELGQLGELGGDIRRGGGRGRRRRRRLHRLALPGVHGFLRGLDEGGDGILQHHADGEVRRAVPHADGAEEDGVIAVDGLHAVERDLHLAEAKDHAAVDEQHAAVGADGEPGGVVHQSGSEADDFLFLVEDIGKGFDLLPGPENILFGKSIDLTLDFGLAGHGGARLE